MAEFIVDWCEQKTSSTGKNYTVATLQGVGDVSIWPDYAHYAEIQPGATLKGVIQTKGKYKNLVSELAKPNFLKAGIAQAVEKKNEYIKESQGRKENSIALAGTARDATLIIVNLYPEFAGEPDKENLIKAEWLKWRHWLLDNLGDQSDITQTKQPF